MCAPCAFDLFAIDEFRARPAFRTAKYDHRPRGQARVSAAPGIFLNGLNLGDDRVQCPSHQLMHRLGFVALDKIWLPTVASEELYELLVVHAPEHRGVRDLVAVEMENRQHRAVARGIQKLIAVPARSQWAGFCFPISDHATNEQLGIVKYRSASVHDRIAQLSTFVDRARGLGRSMARNSS